MKSRHNLSESEHDSTVGELVNELLKSGLDSALKLSLLSEAWTLSKHDDQGGTITDFAIRSGYSVDLIQRELDQLANLGYFKRTKNDARMPRYHLTSEAPPLETVRHLQTTWRDLRYHIRANAVFTFRPGQGAHPHT